MFAETEEIAVGVAQHELVHLPLAWSQRRENGNSGGAELGLESGCRAVAEIEVDATRIVVFDEHIRGAEMELQSAAIEEGIIGAILIGWAKKPRRR